MRYCYHNKAYLNSSAHHGIFCDPVLRKGRCILGRGNQFVIFEDGAIVVVVRRTLRLATKCKQHRNR